MLRLITVLALARISVAATTPPGTGYSDADSCPPPEKAPFGAVTTHTNVEEAFLTLASELLRRTPPEKPQKKRLSLAASASAKGRKCCA